MKRNLEDKYFEGTITVILIVAAIISIYPFYYSIVYALSSGFDIEQHGYSYFFPRSITLENFRMVFEEKSIYFAFLVTVARTIIGGSLGVFFTIMVAYPLSKSYLRFRKFYMKLWVVTMYFNAGIIPFYLVITNIGLRNNFLVYILPLIFNVFNVIICINFLKAIPSALEESARIDGANDFYIFLRVILPISTPLIATIALFDGVGQWNAYFDALYFITSDSLRVLQSIMWKIIAEQEGRDILNNFLSSGEKQQSTATIQSIQYATMIISIIPISLSYPFLQRYFIGGIMIGAVKE